MMISTRIQERLRQWYSSENYTSYCLNLSDLGLESIDASIIPSECRRLYLYDNNLTSIPTPLPLGLEELYMDNNKIETIPENVLPPTLRVLILTYNKIKALPLNLPPNLEMLLVGDNRLQCLPANLPSTIHTLGFGYNKMYTFPSNLPTSLHTCYAHGNLISRLPLLSPHLLNLIVSNNLLLIEQHHSEESGMGINTYLEKLYKAQDIEEERLSSLRIRRRLGACKEELMSMALHPNRVEKWLEAGVLWNLFE